MRLRRASFKAFRRVLALLLPLTNAAAISLAQNTIHVPSDQPTIQAGINAANPGTTVLVAPGTYYENIDFKGKAITVISSDGPAKTIIDGGATTSTVIFKTSELRNSVLSGFTVRNGGPASNATDVGSGVEIEDAAPTIVNNIISGNACHGVEVSGGAPLLQSNTISGTSALPGYCSFNGSGILLIANPPYRLYGLHTIVNGNIIEQNLHAISYDGGGIMIWAHEGPVIENNIIRNNATTGQGGAIASYNSVAVTIVQNLITGNSATNVGAAISLHPPEDTLGPFIGIVASNTITGNTFSGPSTSTDQAAGQVYLEGNLGQYVVVNNIIAWQNSLPALACGTVYNYLSLTPLVIDHNDIYNVQGPAYGGACPDQTGTYGNISADPIFANPASGSYDLRSGSPAIDAGNNSVLTLLLSGDTTLTNDISGHNPRFQDATGKGYPIIDMGAYESVGPQDGNATVLALTPSAYEVTGGTALTLTAKLLSANGIPSGSITLLEDGTQLGSSLIDPSGTATFPVPALVPGIHAFLATYPGQGPFTAAVSVKFYVLVDKYPTTLKLVSSLTPALLGQSVTFTATISSADNTILAPIILSDAGTSLATLTPNSSGIATFTTSTLTVGSHNIQATYAGDATHISATVSVNQQVVNGYPTPTTLTSSSNPATVGQPVTFTTTTTFSNYANIGPAVGTMTFTDGNTILSVQPITAQNNTTATTTFTASSLAVGIHNINVVLSAPNGFASAATLNQIINGLPTSTTLAATPNPAFAAQPVTLTATVSTGGAAPTGTLTFYDGATSLGIATLNTSGSATYTATLTGGTHRLHAAYGGNATLSTSTSNTITETVQLNPSTTTVTVSPNPSTAFQSITLTARVSSPFNGTPISTPACSPSCAAPTVTFFAGTTLLGSAPIGATGTAVLDTTTLTVGTYSLTASFAATSIFAASISPIAPETVLPAFTIATLAATPNPATQLQTVTLTATVVAPLSTVTPGGNLTFLDGITPIGTATLDTHGTATIATNALAFGTHSLTAVYSGSANFVAVASPPVSLVINPQDFTLTVSAATLTIPTEHHAPITVNLTSIGSFADQIALTCTNLPIYATCAFHQSPTKLLLNGNASSILTIDTDVVIGYANNRTTPRPNTHNSSTLTLALLPAGLFFSLTALRRRRLPHRLLLLAITTTLAAWALSGCSGKYPASTPPGTYNITITGHGVNSGLTHTTNLSLIVTP